MPGQHPGFILETLFGYVGPGGGLEFIPYFMAMLAWGGMALLAVLLWPFTTLLRRLRGTRKERGNEPADTGTPSSGANDQDRS
jgi:hypothetical protein